MSVKMKRLKPWQAALGALVDGGGGLLFWMTLSPEEQSAGGTIAIIAFIAMAILVMVVKLATGKPAPPSDQAHD